MEDINDKNLEYLTKDLKFLGFPENVQTSLKDELLISDKQDKFSIRHSATYNKAGGGKDQVDYQIVFNKSGNSERYFLNNFTATLKNESDPTLNKVQTFYINKGEGITAKEAYNLLSGRPVHKSKLHNRENQEYQAWIQLDLNGEKEPNGNFKHKTFHQNYGYDLPAVLANYPIKELSDATQKKELIQGLEKGNVRQVTFLKESGEEKMFLVANPQFKNMLVFDASMKQKTLGVERKEQEPDQKKEKKEKIEQGSDDEESQKDKKKGTRKRVKV
jgi:hypothetical protein